LRPCADKDARRASALPWSWAGAARHAAAPIAAGAATATGVVALNGAGAMALAKALDPAMPVSRVWLATAATKRSTFGGTELPWTRRIIWGTTPLHGHAI